ncbi:hypothetical protein BBG47_27050 [Paenibacillus sp. KS1]|nr:hypothetical protein BBG47_27050 [Paenibacillus sp. KS1]
MDLGCGSEVMTTFDGEPLCDAMIRQRMDTMNPLNHTHQVSTEKLILVIRLPMKRNMDRLRLLIYAFSISINDNRNRVMRFFCFMT